PVTKGETTVGERWKSYTEADGFGSNKAMNSFNHYSLGSVITWLYENVLGIQRDEAHPGYQHFILKPEMGTFRFAKGGMETPYGRIESAWEKNEDGSRFFLRFHVPENTTATLILKEECRELESGNYEFSISANC
ncbi:MAG: alfa-L-rhamnosidase RamA, partial [Lachnospiraceae bacterium]|nr:alfa-L-rhamnosidase RamA [Lachnospiraceae bacterium]